MNRHLSIAWLSLGCLIAAACGGDDPAPTPTPDTGDEDTGDAQTDGSAAPDTDTGTDAEVPDTTADAEDSSKAAIRVSDYLALIDLRSSVAISAVAGK